jgi:hypothetical protein
VQLYAIRTFSIPRDDVNVSIFYSAARSHPPPSGAGVIQGKVHRRGAVSTPKGEAP